MQRGQSWDKAGWSLLVSLAFTMLNIAFVPYFKLGLRLLIQVLAHVAALARVRSLSPPVLFDVALLTCILCTFMLDAGGSCG